MSADGEAAVVAASDEVEALVAARDAAIADADASWSSGGQSKRSPNWQPPSLVSSFEMWVALGSLLMSLVVHGHALFFS